MSILSLFVKFWWVSTHEFKANFLNFWCLYHLIFDVETIGVSLIILWWLLFYKKKTHSNFFLGGGFEFRSFDYLIKTVKFNARTYHLGICWFQRNSHQYRHHLMPVESLHFWCKCHFLSLHPHIQLEWRHNKFQTHWHNLQQQCHLFPRTL